MRGERFRVVTFRCGCLYYHMEDKHMGGPALGSGGRFAALKGKIAKRGDVRNPAAVAASIGRKKYGAKKMVKMAAAGRKRKAGY